MAAVVVVVRYIMYNVDAVVRNGVGRNVRRPAIRSILNGVTIYFS